MIWTLLRQPWLQHLALNLEVPCCLSMLLRLEEGPNRCQWRTSRVSARTLDTLHPMVLLLYWAIDRLPQSCLSWPSHLFESLSGIDWLRSLLKDPFYSLIESTFAECLWPIWYHYPKIRSDYCTSPDRFRCSLSSPLSLRRCRSGSTTASRTLSRSNDWLTI